MQRAQLEDTPCARSRSNASAGCDSITDETSEEMISMGTSVSAAALAVPVMISETRALLSLRFIVSPRLLTLAKAAAAARLTHALLGGQMGRALCDTALLLATSAQQLRTGR